MPPEQVQGREMTQSIGNGKKARLAGIQGPTRGKKTFEGDGGKIPIEGDDGQVALQGGGRNERVHVPD
jgi:hypothetical protein